MVIIPAAHIIQRQDMQAAGFRNKPNTNDDTEKDSSLLGLYAVSLGK
jgi:hypothetical protein